MSQSATIDKDDLIGIFLDFFGAGGETVGTTLSWFILFMMLYPDVQEKCFKEIQSGIGRI